MAARRRRAGDGPGAQHLGEALPLERKLELYYWMQLTRTFDERMLSYWKQGRGVGGTFSERGHEAVSVGAASALGRDDVVVRGHLDPATGQRGHLIQEVEAAGRSEPPQGNTTLTLVVTNQKLDSSSLTQLARQTHSSMARAIQTSSRVFIELRSLILSRARGPGARSPRGTRLCP